MAVLPIPYQHALVRLQRCWLIFTLFCLLFLVSGFALLHSNWDTTYALRWLLLASAATAYLLRVFWTSLKRNKRSGQKELLADLGPGNITSLVRGLLLAGLAGFAFSPQPPGDLAWLPGILYVSAVLGDFLDGFLARLTNRVTGLGETLDISLDGFGVLTAGWLVVWYGQAPEWYLAVPLARYVFLGGAALRRATRRPLYELPPSISRRGLAGVQMGFTAALLLPVFAPPGTHTAAALFAAPFLAGFAKDFLYISGVLRPGKSSLPASFIRPAARLLPLALRLAAAGLLLAGYLSAPPGAGQILALLQLVVLILLLFGAAGRTAALVGLVLLGFEQGPAGLTAVQTARLVLLTAILFLGTGPLSLWTPETPLIDRSDHQTPSTWLGNKEETFQ